MSGEVTREQVWADDKTTFTKLALARKHVECDYLPPSSPDMERSILGGILLDNELIFEAESIIKPSDFSLSGHRMICTALQALAAKQQPLDLLTLLDHFGGDLDKIGGITALAGLTEGIPRRTSLEHYLQRSCSAGKSSMRS